MLVDVKKSNITSVKPNIHSL